MIADVCSVMYIKKHLSFFNVFSSLFESGQTGKPVMRTGEDIWPRLSKPEPMTAVLRTKASVNTKSATPLIEVVERW